MRPRFCFLYTIVAAAVFCCTSLRAQDSLVKKPVITWLKAAASNASAQLQWSLLNNNVEDSVGFVIERSRDGINFQNIAFLLFSSQLAENNFAYTDNNSFADSAFYRITLQRNNNSAVVSELNKVSWAARPKIEVNILPNPVFNNASLILNYEETGDILCTLFDHSGKTIRSYQVKKATAYSQHILEMYNIPRGEYILNIRGNSVNESKRILKQ